ALLERLEDDRGNLLERGAIAEARGVEELVEDDLLCSMPGARRHEREAEPEHCRLQSELFNLNFSSDRRPLLVPPDARPTPPCLRPRCRSGERPAWRGRSTGRRWSASG